MLHHFKKGFSQMEKGAPANAGVILHMDKVYGAQLELVIMVPSVECLYDAAALLKPSTEMHEGDDGWAEVTAALDVVLKLPSAFSCLTRAFAMQIGFFCAIK
jgi:hypothetical protein